PGAPPAAMPPVPAAMTALRPEDDLGRRVVARVVVIGGAIQRRWRRIRGDDREPRDPDGDRQVRGRRPGYREGGAGERADDELFHVFRPPGGDEHAMRAGVARTADAGADAQRRTSGWRRSHSPTAVSQTVRSVVIVKHEGNALGKGPAPSHTITLFAQPWSSPGGMPMRSPPTWPTRSAMKTLP